MKLHVRNSLILVIPVLLFFGFIVKSTFLTRAAFIERRFTCISCNEIKNVMHSYVREEAAHKIALIDFDETLTKGKKAEGGGAWFGKSMQYLQDAKKLSFDESRDAVVGLYRKHLFANDVELVENGWLQLIASFHEQEIPVTILTRRSAEFGDLTTGWAERLGLAFTHGYFGKEAVVQLSKDPARHYKGGLFCGLNSKQETLNHFLSQRHENVPFTARLAVLFADDDERYLNDVAEGLKKFSQKNNIPVTFYGVHYTALKEQGKAFALNESHIKELDDVYCTYAAVNNEEDNKVTMVAA